MLHISNSEVFLTCQEGKRKIGELVKDQDGSLVYTRKFKAKHIFRKDNSLGINYDVINLMANSDKMIFIRDNGTRYSTTAGDVRTKGRFLHFLHGGYEKQIFMPLEYMKTE